MNMDDIRGESPEAARREIWTKWLAYNLIRKTMAQAAVRHPMALTFLDPPVLTSSDPLVHAG